ncbi:beta-ribofuranosylaminobenzene 5'-phosphate synthase family protein [Pseudomonas sp. SO81]|uniref:beta-ribofuranosylaminobenzene 5'-phosphate synthase family protein n=1 Tax=Pseudomonas sp. SO81 TaxID=2983246 RepID=UPI0025A3AF67|nr:beta-ribofuranosylaminobenzene 5'-phosphate synthase family protein [Pseudomonas sp. SO81]
MKLGLVQVKHMSRMIRISVPARLHVNLFDLSDCGYRQNGGVGFCVSGFDTVIDFKVSDEFAVIDRRDNGLSAAEIASLVDHLQELYRVNDLSKKVAVDILSGPPPHSGFGTGTATKLACVEAAFLINNIKVNQEQLVSASGRGGTSGVGINTYFHGGLSVDFGIKASGLSLAPSSARTSPLAKPLQLLNIKLPTSWKFGVIVFLGARGVSAKDEIDFFNRTCPVSQQSVHASIYHAVSGMACAALENDYLTFGASVSAIQMTEWKRAEWAIQPSLVCSLRDKLKDSGAESVGLSSFGPALYFLASDVGNVIDKIDLPNSYIAMCCSPNNSGREIKLD